MLGGGWHQGEVGGRWVVCGSDWLSPGFVSMLMVCVR